MATLIQPNGTRYEVKPISGEAFSREEIIQLLKSKTYKEINQQAIPEVFVLAPVSAPIMEYNPLATKMFSTTLYGNIVMCSDEEYPEQLIEEKKEECVHPFQSLTFQDGFVTCNACGSDLQKESRKQ